MAFDQVSKMNKVIFGDCRDTMRDLKDQGVRVQMCVTSPPYFGLRDYGHPGQIGLEKTPAEFVAALVEVFDGVRELLADDGVLWLNLGDSYARTGGTDRKVSESAQVGSTRNTLEQMCDRTTKAQAFGLKPKDLIGIPWRVAFALQEAGWYLRQDVIWHKPNPMPESVTDRCTKAHEYLFLLSKSERYYFDQKAILEPVSPNTHARLSQNVQAQIGSERANGGAKTNGNMKAVGRKFDPGAGNKNNPSFDAATAIMPDERNKRSVWTVPTQPYSGAHFATFPPALIEPCILAGSRPGDLVLDPFMGSGTTAQVAQQLGRQWIGCELNTEYAPLQQARTAQTALAI
jgi:site-specific DNA-methyltransferase (cytosine-N4-specific)